MQKYLLYLTSYMMIFIFFACHNKEKAEEEEVHAEEVQTPVTVTSITNEPLMEYAELNATSIYLQDNIVKSNINGYIKAVNTKVGQ